MSCWGKDIDHVFHIFGTCHPTQIHNPVVGFLPIYVVAFLTFGARTDERFKHEAVHEIVFLPVVRSVVTGFCITGFWITVL